MFNIIYKPWIYKEKNTITYFVAYNYSYQFILFRSNTSLNCLITLRNLNNTQNPNFQNHHGNKLEIKVLQIIPSNTTWCPVIKWSIHGVFVLSKLCVRLGRYTCNLISWGFYHICIIVCNFIHLILLQRVL